MRSSTVYAILEKNLPLHMMEGYQAGIINEQGDRLYAFTFVDQDLQAFENDHGNSIYSSTGVDDEKARIYLDGGTCYQHKDTSQCIEEGIYTAFALKFYGILYAGRWYVSKELMYFGELISRQEAVDFLSEYMRDGSILISDYYQPMESSYPIYSPNETPLSRGIEFAEFVGLPTLVAYIKQEEKQALLRAHAKSQPRSLYAQGFLPLEGWKPP